MNSLGNLNHAVSVVGKWIFDYKYQKALPLTIESLNIICFFSDKEKTVTLFDNLNDAKYINTKVNKSVCRSGSIIV